MRTRSKLLLAGLTAALVLSMGVASSSAGRLSVSNRNIRVVWSSLELESSAGTVRCPVTLEGSFHSATIRKTEGALVGHISRGTVVGANCTGGTATVNQEALPWHVQYAGFTGALPNITRVRLQLINAKFTVRIGSLTCTAQTTQANPAAGEAALGGGGAVTGLAADETIGIPLRGSFLCEIGGEGAFRGTGTVTLLGNAAAISVRLI